LTQDRCLLSSAALFRKGTIPEQTDHRLPEGNQKPASTALGSFPGAAALTGRGHQVLIEKGAGLGSGIPDAAYQAAGAKIVEKAADVWSRAEMIVKVKEPVAGEYGLMREGQTVYTYFHLAADKPLTKALLERKVTAVSLRDHPDRRRTAPLLKPMSEVAGRMAVQVGAVQLEKGHGARGCCSPAFPASAAAGGHPRGRHRRDQQREAGLGHGRGHGDAWT